MFCVINYDDGAVRYGDFRSYTDALNYAESEAADDNGFTIEEYDSEEDYFNNIEGDSIEWSI